MPKVRELAPEAFELLLKWLDPDRDKAGEQYEAIRHRLLTFFYGRGCLEADDLTDQTITIVADKVLQLKDHYEGKPIYYFIGVARKVYQEHLRSERQTPLLPPPPPGGWTEQDYRCLEQCLDKLAPRDRNMFEEYYDRRECDREKFAEECGISLNALRIRMHQIKKKLRACFKNCLDREGE